ncbi:hypothetical protein NH340_JMT08763 [Sarcoptes scabiei]|nr:hypothetical protein NH340_JMT08763 [Sarcoptes scabiei]
MDENWESIEIFESFEDSFVSWGPSTTTATKDSSAQIDCDANQNHQIQNAIESIECSHSFGIVDRSGQNETKSTMISIDLSSSMLINEEQIDNELDNHRKISKAKLHSTCVSNEESIADSAEIPMQIDSNICSDLDLSEIRPLNANDPESITFKVSHSNDSGFLMLSSIDDKSSTVETVDSVINQQSSSSSNLNDPMNQAFFQSIHQQQRQESSEISTSINTEKRFEQEPPQANLIDWNAESILNEENNETERKKSITTKGYIPIDSNHSTNQTINLLDMSLSKFQQINNFIEENIPSKTKSTKTNHNGQEINLLDLSIDQLPKIENDLIFETQAVSSMSEDSLADNSTNPQSIQTKSDDQSINANVNEGNSNVSLNRKILNDRNSLIDLNNATCDSFETIEPPPLLSSTSSMKDEITLESNPLKKNLEFENFKIEPEINISSMRTNSAESDKENIATIAVEPINEIFEIKDDKESERLDDENDTIRSAKKIDTKRSQLKPPTSLIEVQKICQKKINEKISSNIPSMKNSDKSDKSCKGSKILQASVTAKKPSIGSIGRDRNCLESGGRTQIPSLIPNRLRSKLPIISIDSNRVKSIGSNQSRIVKRKDPKNL